MPLFDEWGLLPEGIEGPHENLVFVAPLLIDPAACAPSVEAGGRAPPSAVENSSGGSALLEAQEPQASGVPAGAAAEPAQHQAPEAEASDVRDGGSRAAAGDEEPTNGPGAVSQEATPGAPALGTSAPDITPDAPPPEDRSSGPGRRRLCLESLLKRKRSPAATMVPIGR